MNLLLLATLALAGDPSVAEVRGAVFLQDGIHPHREVFDPDAWKVLAEAIGSRDPLLRKEGLVEATRALHVWKPPADELRKLDKLVAKVEADAGWPATNLRWLLQSAAADPATRRARIEDRLRSDDPVQQREALALLMVHRGDGVRELLDQTRATWLSRGKHADALWIDAWLHRLDMEQALVGLDPLEAGRHLKEAIDAEIAAASPVEARGLYLRWLVLTLGDTDDERVAGWLRSLLDSSSVQAQLAAQAAMIYRGELSKPTILIRRDG